MSQARRALETLDHMGSAMLNDLSDDELFRFTSLCAKWQQQGERRLMHRRERQSKRSLSYSALADEGGADSVTFTASMS